jgi:hypothetical protein
MTRAWAVSAVVVTAIVVIVVGVARAGAPDPDYRTHAIGTIRSIDRAHNAITLSDGLRLRATDGQMLEDLEEGDLVKVGFAHEGGGWVIRTIEGGQAGAQTTDRDGE